MAVQSSGILRGLLRLLWIAFKAFERGLDDRDFSASESICSEIESWLWRSHLLSFLLLPNSSKTILPEQDEVV